MNECKRCRELLKEALYGDLEPAGRESLETHLGRCEDCRRDYDELRSTLGLMERHVRPEPDAAFWEGYWDRLGARMSSEKVFYEKAQRRPFPFMRPSFTVPRWAYQVSAAVLLVVVGMFIGRMFLAPPPVVVRSSPSPGVTSSPVSLELASRTQRYVQRSKLILMAVVNFNPDTEDSYVLDLDYQKKASQELVQEADWLKRELSDSRQRRLQELVEDLEAVLLQIAALESEEVSDVVELVRAGFENRGILLKLHLAEVNRPWERLETKGPLSKKSKEL